MSEIGEIIQVDAGGQRFVDWISCTVIAGFRKATREFTLVVSEVSGPDGKYGPWHFPPGTEVTIRASGDVLVTGHVLRYNPSAVAQEHQVVLVGAGYGYNYVNSSPVHETGYFERKTILQIAQELDKFGARITASAEAMADAMEVLPWFQIRRGSTAWAEMMRLLPQRGLTMSGLANGAIEIVKNRKQLHAGGLIEGENIERMSAVLTIERLFQRYEAIGQNRFGVEEDSFELSAEVTDPSVGFFSNKEIIFPDDATKENIKKFAETELRRANGLSKTAEISTPSFRDAAGRLWEPGVNVYVYAPTLKLDQEMAIDHVVFQQDDGQGTIATLSLVLPEAQDGESAPASNSDSMWGFFGNFLGGSRP